MNAKRTGIILILLWLTGCAAVDLIDKTDPDGATDAAVQKDTKAGADSNQARQATKTAATVDAEYETTTSTSDEMEVLTLARLLERLDRVATLQSGSTNQHIKQMDARFETLNPADKYEFALLLTRKPASGRSLKRAISILNELQAHVTDRIVREILQLHRRYFDLQRQYRSERNKTIELEKKIEHLKGLEQDLDKSNTRMQESLNPMPGDTQQQ
jgi:hypothetical protein